MPRDTLMARRNVMYMNIAENEFVGIRLNWDRDVKPFELSIGQSMKRHPQGN